MGECIAWCRFLEAVKKSKFVVNSLAAGGERVVTVLMIFFLIIISIDNEKAENFGDSVTSLQT